jgi:hypothetical protein
VNFGRISVGYWVNFGRISVGYWVNFRWIPGEWNSRSLRAHKQCPPPRTKKERKKERKDEWNLLLYKQCLRLRTKKIVFGGINRRSQFRHSPIQVLRNRPNHTPTAPIVPVDCAETSLLPPVQLAPRYILVVLKIRSI